MSITDGFTVVTPPASRREEARQDRLLQARIDREREEAREAARLAALEAAARVKREQSADRDARRAARAMARREFRAAAVAAVSAWLAGHVTGLLLAPVIAVPAALAWTAMAAYGARLYGPPGRALPAFSEGAMWAFAAAVTLTRHRDAKRRQEDPDADPSPVWHLLAGTGVFAAFGFALNFAHGYSAGLGHGTAAGVTEGAVMGLISVAGVVAHQIVSAGPRRTRVEKDAAKIARLERKRLAKAARKAVDAARVEIDADGCARLVYEPTADAGADTSAPETDTPADMDAATGTDTVPCEADTDTATTAVTDTASDADTGAVIVPDTEAPAVAVTADTDTDTAADTPRPRKRTPRADTAKPPGRTAKADTTTAEAVTRLRQKHPEMPATVIAERLGISPRTARRHLAGPTETS